MILIYIYILKLTASRKEINQVRSNDELKFKGWRHDEEWQVFGYEV